MLHFFQLEKYDVKCPHWWIQRWGGVRADPIMLFNHSFPLKICYITDGDVFHIGKSIYGSHFCHLYQYTDNSAFLRMPGSHRVLQFMSHFHVTVPQLDKKSESQNWSKRTLHNGAQWLVQNQVVVQSRDVVTSKPKWGCPKYSMIFGCELRLCELRACE